MEIAEVDSEFHLNAFMINIPKLFALASMLLVSLSQAAYVTIDEAGMDAVFSQASFGRNTVDIRIGATTELVRPDLLNINTDAQIDILFGLHVGPAKAVNFYFIDTIQDSCGVVGAGVIGCGELPGNSFLVESAFADDSSIPGGGNISVGVQLLSHELGHNLGLSHRSGPDLMNPFINGFGDLDAAEVASILASALVQTDPLNGQRFILIDPVLIVATGTPPPGVPEPASVLLVMFGLLALGAKRRK